MRFQNWREHSGSLWSGANTFFTIGQIENGIQLAKKAIADALKGELTV